jgi:hypothetical protein
MYLGDFNHDVRKSGVTIFLKDLKNLNIYTKTNFQRPLSCMVSLLQIQLSVSNNLITTHDLIYITHFPVTLILKISLNSLDFVKNKLQKLANNPIWRMGFIFRIRSQLFQALNKKIRPNHLEIYSLSLYQKFDRRTDRGTYSTEHI